MNRGSNGKTLGGRAIEVVDIGKLAPVSAPPMPEGLQERGQAEWTKIWTAGKWLWPDQDAPWIEMICKAWDRIALFEARIQADGPMVPGSRPAQLVAHPLYTEIKSAENTIQQCLSRIGFSPTDRARLKLTELKSEKTAQDILNNDVPEPDSSPRVVASYVEGEW